VINNEDFGFTLLHYAIINYYNMMCKKGEELHDAINIVKALLENNADPTIISKPITYLRSSNGDRTTTEGVNPSQMFIRLTSYHMDLSDDLLMANSVEHLSRLLEPSVAVWREKHDQVKLVTESARLFLSSLRQNPHPNVITFCCKDGVNVTAHPAILSASSAYFKTYFDGPWAEAHPDGRWETAYIRADEHHA
jgi:BTB/POZ domain/Ankyrin repeat